MPAVPVVYNKPEAIPTAAWARLRDMVAARTPADGRTDALYPGLRCYRFSRPARYEKTQRLTPGVVVVLQGSKTAHLGDRRSLDYGATQCLVPGPRLRAAARSSGRAPSIRTLRPNSRVLESIRVTVELAAGREGRPFDTGTRAGRPEGSRYQRASPSRFLLGQVWRRHTLWWASRFRARRIAGLP